MKHSSIRQTVPAVLIIILIVISVLLLCQNTLQSAKITLMENIIELQTPSSTNKIFIFRDKQTGIDSLYTSDNQFTPSSLRKIYTLSGPENNLANIRHIDNYILVDNIGGNQSSFIIFDQNGTNIPITGTSGWYYSFNHFNELTKRIVVDLSQINGSQGTAEINIATGKIVPGSIKISSR
jgi:hypothetical protein